MARASGKSDTDQNLVRLGDAIRRLRQAKGLSQEGLAHEAGIDRSHMSQIERGQRNVTFLNLLKIARGMGLPASEIIAAAGL